MSDLYQYDDMAAFTALSKHRKDIDSTIPDGQKEKIKSFAKSIDAGSFPGFSITSREEDLPALHLLVENWQQNFKHIIVLGVGGSSLGAQTLTSFARSYAAKEVELHYLDNVDPYRVEGLIDNLPLDQTAVLSVSKSGSTIETLAQTLLFIEAFEAKNLPIDAHVIGLTENKPNPLRRLLEGYKVPILNHPDDVGGRFTIFTLVGLIPAILSGMNVFKLRQGAFDVLKQFIQNPLASNPYYGALTSAGLGEDTKPIQYMMPYSDRLRKMSDWFVQLWAESLGKESKGTTPVAAVGSTDQHSALQLLMDGPKDKLVTFIIPSSVDEGKGIPKEKAQKVGLDYLSNLNLGKLIYHQAQGTAEALTAAGVPVRIFYTEKLNEQVLGALLMHFMLETAIAGVLLDVNTWNQPGVEDGKKRTLNHLQGGAH